MVLNFKLDHNNKLWLLWCSSMRLAADKFALKKPFPVNISGDITVPDKFKDSVFRNSNLPSTFFREKYFICPGSGEIVEASDSFEISYKTMIASHEEDRRQKIRELRSQSSMSGGRTSSMSNKSGKTKKARSPSPACTEGEVDPYAIMIPPLLKVIDKELTLERYKRLLGSAEFLSQKVRVSYPTYMKCTRNVVEAPDAVLERMIALKNTEDLGLEPPKEKESPLARNRAKLQAQAEALQ